MQQNYNNKTLLNLNLFVLDFAFRLIVFIVLYSTQFIQHIKMCISPIKNIELLNRSSLHKI